MIVCARACVRGCDIVCVCVCVCVCVRARTNVLHVCDMSNVSCRFSARIRQ